MNEHNAGERFSSRAAVAVCAFLVHAGCSAANSNPSSGGGGSSSTTSTGGSNPFQGCPGTSLDADGALDMNLQSVLVSGVVTLAGAPLPDAEKGRGTLFFTGKNGLVPAPIDLGAAGPVSYTIPVPPGTYDIVYQPDPNACSAAGAQPPTPCAGGTLLADVAITGDGALDINIPVIDVSGSVTLDGAPLPDAGGDRGKLVLANENGQAESPLGKTGPGHYGLKVLPGVYDVRFQGNSSLCAGASFPAVPCNSGVVTRSISLTESGLLDVDVKSVKVSSAVKVAGGPLPAAMADRGNLTFIGMDEDVFITPPLGKSGDVTYSLTLLAGTYAVGFQGQPANCPVPGTVAPDMPCGGGLVIQSFELTSDGALGIDIPRVKVTGAVTLQNAPLPASAKKRGIVDFRTAGGEGLQFDLGISGAVSYAVTLLPDTYDIFFKPEPEGCSAGTLDLPCGGGPLRTALPLMSDGALDIDIPRAKVSGTVTLHGAPLPDSPFPRGSLVFRGAAGDPAVSADLSATGAATYGVALIPGKYDILWSPSASLCQAGSTEIPCISGVVLAGVDISTDGALDVDMKPVHVSGDVQLQGGILPDWPGGRGSLAFTLLDEGSTASIPMKSSGPFHYQAAFLPGLYVVSHVPAPSECAGPGAKIPCAGQFLHGCDSDP